MAEQWTSFSIDLGPVNPIASGVKKVTSAISTALNIQKTALNIIATLALDLLNIEATLIKAALSIIEDTLDDYVVTDAKMHALVVPPRRQLPYKLPSTYTMPQEEDSWSIDDTLDADTKRNFQQVLKVVAEHDQGNPGFARTFIESLYDEFDPNKPEYDDSDAIFAVVIVAGAQTMLGLYDLLAAIQGVFGTALRGNPLIPANITRTPQDLKATPIAAPGTSRIGVRLSWKNADPLQTLAEYDGGRVVIQEVAVIRSTDDEMMIAENWGTLFGGYQPTALADDENSKEDVKTTDDGKTELLRIFKYDNIRDAYVDDDKNLEKGVDYYYALAYRYGIAEEADGTDSTITLTAQDYHQISNVVKVRVREDKVPSTHLSVQPNWVTHPSFLDMIPDLKFFMKLIENYVASLKSQLVGSASALANYVKFLKAEVDRYNAFATEINNRIAKLAGLLQLPATGIYMTVISSDSGGNQKLIKELVTRLTDETDTSAPPFFRNGLVGGLVLVAGAPNPAELSATKTLVSLLLGLESELTTKFEDAVNSIDAALKQVEATTFDDETVGYKTFDDGMQGVDADSADANVPFDP